MTELIRYTKDQAWGTGVDEVRIPLDLTQHQFRFTRRWFKTRNLTTWSTFLPPQYPASQPVNMIQIGVFEGMDLIWCLQNLLTHPESRVLAVDPWYATRKLTEERMATVMGNAHHNLRPYRKQVSLVRGESGPELSKVIESGVQHKGKSIRAGEWDLVVIDGDHRAPGVYEDACNALELLKPGGWMLFDDVRNNRKKRGHVFEGLQDFIEDHGDEIKEVWYHRFCNCYQKV